MKKEEFLKLGLNEDLAQKCEVASGEELRGFIPKARFDEVNNEKKKLEIDVNDRDIQLEQLKDSTGNVEIMKKQIETLQGENKLKNETHAQQMKEMRIQNAVETALLTANAKNIKAVTGLLDMSQLEVGDDGKITGLARQIEALQQGADSGFLFQSETKEQPQFKGFTPGESQSGERTIPQPTTLAEAVKTHFINK